MWRSRSRRSPRSSRAWCASRRSCDGSIGWWRRPIAHRGLHDKAKGVVENTEAAFAAAIAQDYAIECDLQLSRDGEAMVFHDDTLDRLDGRKRTGERQVGSRTEEQLRSRIRHARMQTLAEMLDQVAGRATLVIEIKSHWDGDNRLADRALSVLEPYEGPYALMSFDPDIIAHVRERSPLTVRGIVADRTTDAYYAHLPLAAASRTANAFACRSHAAAFRFLLRGRASLSSRSADCGQQACRSSPGQSARRNQALTCAALQRPDHVRRLRRLNERARGECPDYSQHEGNRAGRVGRAWPIRQARHSIRSCLMISCGAWRNPARRWGRTGWQGAHLVLADAQGKTLGLAPCYLKNHSYGEYVFDHGWAEAFERAGGDYYPKLQVERAVHAGDRAETSRADPGTARCACEWADCALRANHRLIRHMTFLPRRRLGGVGRRALAQAAGHPVPLASMRAMPVSMTFSRRCRHASARTSARNAKRCADAELKSTGSRETTSPKRHWDAFFEFYMETGSRKWGTPYLTRRFFSLIGEAMAKHILLVMCRRDGRIIAGALNFIGSRCSLRPQLGRDRASRLPAFRGLLLPGHRLRHRA